MAKIKRNSNHLEIWQECQCCFISFNANASNGQPDKLSVEITMRDEDMEKQSATELVFFYEELKAMRDYLNDMISFAEGLNR